MVTKQNTREALEYIQSYIEECDHWDNKEPLLGDIAKFLAQQPAVVVKLTDEEIIAEYELEMQQSLRGHEKANVIRVCRKAIAAHIAKQSGDAA